MKLPAILDSLRKYAFYLAVVFIPLLSAVMHRRTFSTDIMGVHAWRQAYTQSFIVNFAEEDFNILHPRQNGRGATDGIQRVEFPLMQWLFAVFYKIFGNHFIISRILTFCIGAGTTVGLFVLLKNLFADPLAGLVGAWTLTFSPAFFYYTVNPLPDNLALCCAIWGLAFFFNWYRCRHHVSLLAAGFLMSLGALCKLPFGIFFSAPFLCFWLEYREKKAPRLLSRPVLTTVFFLLLPLAWYSAVIPGWHGNPVVQGILANSPPVATLLRYVLDNLVSVLPEMLLNYASVPFFVAGIYYARRRELYRDRRFALLAVPGLLALCYFLFEINIIANIHDYYLFPFLPLLFILVAYGAVQMLTHEQKVAGRLALILLLLAPVAAYLRMLPSWDPERPGFNKDWLNYKQELRRAAPKNALCVLGNDVSNAIFFYYADKKGWSFSGDRLSAERLQGMIREGAQYLYSDSRAVDGNPEIRPMLDSLMLEKGSVHVFRLKKREK